MQKTSLMLNLIYNKEYSNDRQLVNKKKISKEFTSFCFNGSHKKNGKHRAVRSLSAVSPLILINLTSTFANISHGNACFATQANWSRSRVVWPAYNFHLSIVSTVSFIFDFVVEVMYRIYSNKRPTSN